MNPEDRPESNEQDDLDQGAVDADAVCAQCGMVNVPGTLFCRACGTNLRDQRQLRLAEGHEPLVGERVQPRRILTGLLAVLGALILIWTAINADTVEEWLTARFLRAAGGEAFRPFEFWSGRQGRLYDELAQFLEEHPITAEEMRAAPASISDDYSGRYVIKAVGWARDGSSIGSAYVKQEGDTLYAVGKLGAATEVRGRLRTTSRGPIVRQAAVRAYGDYAAAFGYAEFQPDGSLLCVGQSGAGDALYQAVAYRIP